MDFVLKLLTWLLSREVMQMREQKHAVLLSVYSYEGVLLESFRGEHRNKQDLFCKQLVARFLIGNTAKSAILMTSQAAKIHQDRKFKEFIASNPF